MMGSGTKIKYADIAVGAAEAFSAAAEDKTSFSALSALTMDTRPASILHTCEQNVTLLDGTALPRTEEDTVPGIWSDSVTDGHGCFSSPVEITLTADALFTSPGITLVFDEESGVFARRLTITWYRDEEMLSAKEITPDNPVSFCDNRVEHFNRIVLRVTEMNMPYVRLRLYAVIFGRVRWLYGRELTEVSVIQQCSPQSTELAVNTMDFTLQTKENVDYFFSRRQPLQLYHRDRLLGAFYVASAARSGERTYRVQTEDAVGLLDTASFRGDIYRDKNAYELLGEIFSSANLAFTMEDALKTKTVSGWLPASSCREAAAQVLLAIGAAMDTTGREAPEVFVPGETPMGEFPLRVILQGMQVDEDDPITALILTEHSYAETDQAETLYRARDSGAGSRIHVQFPEPMHSLAITDGTILSSCANDAQIDAGSDCTLTGCRYLHTERILTKYNPLADGSDLPRVVEVRGATLITRENADACLASLFAYYAGRRRVRMTAAVEDRRPGDCVTVALPYSADSGNSLAGHIESMRYRLTGGRLIAELEIRGKE